MEWRRPFAQDVDDFKRRSDAFLFKWLEDARTSSSLVPPRSSGTASTTSSLPPSPNNREGSPKGLLAAAPIKQTRETPFENSSPEDDFHNEIRVIADVNIYFDIAWKRTFDIVPMFVAEYFIQFSDKLRNILFQRLGLYGENGDDKCREYAAEDPEMAIKRARIEEQLKVLGEAADILNQF